MGGGQDDVLLCSILSENLSSLIPSNCKTFCISCLPCHLFQALYSRFLISLLITNIVLGINTSKCKQINTFQTLYTSLADLLFEGESHSLRSD